MSAVSRPSQERLKRWHQPWRFVIPRWFKCWRTTRHHERAFIGGGRQWTECYCGLRCFARLSEDRQMSRPSRCSACNEQAA